MKALYNNPIACLHVNNYVIYWFTIGSGVKQRDYLSDTFLVCL